LANRLAKRSKIGHDTAIFKNGHLLMRILSVLGAFSVCVAVTIPSLSHAEMIGGCAISTTTPTLIITVIGLKDRKGRLRAELYPDNDTDFLADNDGLVKAGKPFRRVDLELARTAGTTLCMNTPPPGTYAFSLLHDRNLNLKFDVFSDGVGFAGNPSLGRSKPKAAQARIRLMPGANRLTIVLNYLRGFSFRPLSAK
jgi:uncharacterized protein (DUF2141 family)